MLPFAANPPIRPNGVGTIAQFKSQWWVAHTKPRCEKAFAWDLVRQEINFFIPMVERVKFVSGKKRRVVQPLFSSYVFFNGDDDARHQAMETKRLCQIIPVFQQNQLVEELVCLERTLVEGVQIDCYPFAAMGSRCRIKAGPLQGIEGVVVDRGRSARLVLKVTILGQGASFEVDADLLEPVDLAATA